MTDLHAIAARQQEAQAQMDAAMHPIVTMFHTQLTAGPVQKLLKSLTEANDLLPTGQVKEQIGNVIIVLTAVPNFLASEMARLTPADGGPIDGVAP